MVRNGRHVEDRSFFPGACGPTGRSTGDDAKPWGGVDWLTVHEHAEIQMRAVSDTRSTDRRDHIPGLHRAFALRDRRSQAPEMAVNADESLMLDQLLESARAFPLGADVYKRARW